MRRSKIIHKDRLEQYAYDHEGHESNWKKGKIWAKYNHYNTT
jgi:hypothetical protein